MSLCMHEFTGLNQEISLGQMDELGMDAALVFNSSVSHAILGSKIPDLFRETLLAGHPLLTSKSSDFYTKKANCQKVKRLEYIKENDDVAQAIVRCISVKFSMKVYNEWPDSNNYRICQINPVN